MEDEIKLRFEALEKRVEILERKNLELNSSATTSVTKRQSIREFFNDFKPRTNNDKVLAIAYYREIIQGTTPHTLRDFEGGFRDSKEPAPGNVSLPIFYNVKNGFLMKSELANSKANAWELTNTGVEEVKKRLAINRQSLLEGNNATQESEGMTNE